MMIKTNRHIRDFILVIVLIVNSLSIYSQQIYLSTESSIKLFSEAPLENITAVNKSSKAILNLQNNEIAIKIPMQQFDFPNKLMQEHFNENYMESERFPFAIFKGKINNNIDWTKPVNTIVSVSGLMTLHGVQKTVAINGKLFFHPMSNLIIMEANFKIALTDYEIEVPTLLLSKIAEKVEVNVQFKLSPMGSKGIATAIK